MGLLRDTAAALAATATEAELFAALERALAGSRDLPFTLIYLLDDSGRRALVARSGIAATHPAAAAIVQLDDDAAPWPLAAAQGAPVVVELSDRVAPLPTGPWPEAPKHAIIAPIEQSGQGRAGVIVAGLNPYRPFDDTYRSFVEPVRRPDCRRPRQRARPTRKSGAVSRRWPSSIARRRRSSATSATSSGRR